MITPKNIWLFAQNKPTLIVRDFEKYGINNHIVYSILLMRGVFKWLSVRRRLIKLKDEWKNNVNYTLQAIKVVKGENNPKRLYWLRGYLKAYEECRRDIRQLCHSGRWQAPDNDKKAQEFLRGLSE